MQKLHAAIHEKITLGIVGEIFGAILVRFSEKNPGMKFSRYFGGISRGSYKIFYGRKPGRISELILKDFLRAESVGEIDGIILELMRYLKSLKDFQKDSFEYFLNKNLEEFQKGFL